MKGFESFRAFRWFAVLAALWFSAPLASGQPPPGGDWDLRFQEVLHGLEKLSEDEAADRLRVLRSEAATPEQEAVAALALARLLAGGATESQREADAYFEQAVRIGSGRLALDARNAWGVALLRQGRYGESIEVLRALADGTRSGSLSRHIDASTQARYLYNYGAALERTRQIQESIIIYEKALHLDPGLDLASDALFRLTFAFGSSERFIPAPAPTVIASLNALFGPLLDSGRTETADRYLSALWDHRLIFGELDEVFPCWAYWLVRYLTAARVSPADFDRDWLPRLQNGSLEDPIRSSLWFRRIREAYQVDLPIALEQAPAQSLTSPWSLQTDTADALSELLLVVGDAFRTQGQRRAALAHYALAWSSAGNWKAGAYLVDLLQQSSTELDPQRRILASLVSASRGTEVSPRDARAWRDLSRFHVLLAQDQEERGATQESLEEWQRAVKAHEQANLLSGSNQPAPGLYAGLGKAHAESGRQESARGFLLIASQQYLAMGRPDLARAVSDGPGENLQRSTVADFGFVLENRWEASTGAVRSLAIEPNGTRLVAVGTQGARVFAIQEGKVQPLGPLSGTHKEVLGAAVGPDGKLIALVDGTGSLFLYDTQTFVLLAEVANAHKGEATAVGFTSDGAYVLTGGEDGRVKAWTPRGEFFAEVSKGSPHKAPVVFLAGVPPGRAALSVGLDRRVVLWQVDTQRAIRPTLVDMDIRSAAVGGGGQVLALGLQKLRGNLHRSAPLRSHEIRVDDRVRLIDAGSGIQMRDLEGEEKDLETVGVTPDGRFVATAGSGSSASVWDVATGKLITRIPFDEPVSALAFSPDGRSMVTGTEKGALSLYRLSGVGPAIIQAEPSGKLMIIILDPRATQGSSEPLRVDAGTLRIHGKVKADALLQSLEVDGQEITSIVPDGEGNYLFTANVQLVAPGRRQIEILAQDQKGARARESITVERTAQVRPHEPGTGRRLALLIGISDYADPSLRLDYADDDAKALYDLLTSPSLGPAAFRKEDVMLLLDGHATATRINIGLREFLQRARENDFVLFFFAGHGVPDPNRLSDLYLMAHDSLPDNVAGTGILMRHVREAISEIPARDVLILSDACHSAGIGAPKGFRNAAVNPIHQTFLEKMMHSSGGLAILTASEAAQASLESSKNRHGIFTNYLLQGLHGDADTDHDGIVTLGEIMEYVRDKVKKETNGLQIPAIGPTSFDRSFPLVIVPRP